MEWVNGNMNRSAVVTAISKSCRLPTAIAAILVRRGYDSPEMVREFLEPDISRLPSPFLLKGMQAAVEILGSAIRAGKTIVVYGDYDVDGLTASAVLALFLETVGVPFVCLQPHRIEDGYGVHLDKLQQVAVDPADAVLVTVDCGITDLDAIRDIGALGFTTIITDHHKPAATLPPADAIINPRQPGCSFPYKELAGVGVAFYLLMGLRRHLVDIGFWSREEAVNLLQFLDLVAIGSLADLVPLTGVNRVFAKVGLEVLRKKRRPGLLELGRLSGIHFENISGSDILYYITPRLNAAGRLGGAQQAFSLLLEKDAARAREQAQALDLQNSLRKQCQEEVFREAVSVLEANWDQQRKSIVLAGDWHPGVVGIVASMLAKKYRRPAAVLAPKDASGTYYRGSVRSVAGVDIHEVLQGCSALAGFGGHKSAAGLTVSVAAIDAFREEFEAGISRQMQEISNEQLLSIDGTVSLKDLTSVFFAEYRKLEPFGVANEEPVFAFVEGKLAGVRVVGEKHLKFSWLEDDVEMGGIGFQFGNFFDDGEGVDNIQIACQLRLNDFRGKVNWQMHLVDVKRL